MHYQFHFSLCVILCSTKIVAAIGKESPQSEEFVQNGVLSPPEPMSTLYLKRLIESDPKVLKILREVYRELIMWTTNPKFQNLKHHLSRFLNDYDGSSGRVPPGDDRTTKILQNPLLILRLIFRFAIDLTAIKLELNQLQSAPAVETLDNLQAVLPKQAKPDIVLLEDAMDRLIQIVQTHDLEPSHVAAGIFQNTSTGFRLDQRHVLKLSIHASDTGYYAIAVEFAELAHQMAIQETNQSAVEEAEKHLERVTSLHDVDYEEISGTQYNFFAQKINSLKAESQHEQQRIRQRSQYGAITQSETFAVKQKRECLKLCSGQNFQTEETKSQLNCWYDTKLNPMFQINPLRAELYSKDPLVVEYHNFVSDSDADWLIREVEPRMEKSYVGNSGSAENSKERRALRTAFSFYINSEMNCSFCDKLRTKVQAITGLNTNQMGVDSLKLASYTYGGVFSLHHDAASKRVAEMHYPVLGTAVATFMLYLNDVESGGHTVFPQLGVGVKPRRGSALLWYNMNHKDEDPLPGLHHAGCPVILGGPKWIANMWVRVREQFLTWKCPAKD